MLIRTPSGFDAVQDPHLDCPSGFTAVCNTADGDLFRYNPERIIDTLGLAPVELVERYVEAVETWWLACVQGFTLQHSRSTVVADFIQQWPAEATLLAMIAERNDTPLDEWLAPNRT